MLIIGWGGWEGPREGPRARGHVAVFEVLTLYHSDNSTAITQVPQHHSIIESSSEVYNGQRYVKQFRAFYKVCLKVLFIPCS